jgi:hypothetical protein
MKQFLRTSCLLSLAIAVATLTFERMGAQAPTSGVPNFEWDPIGITAGSRIAPPRYPRESAPPRSNQRRRAAALRHHRSSNSIRTDASFAPSEVQAIATSGRQPSTACTLTTRATSGSPGNGKGDNRILKFTNTGQFLIQIGRRNQSTGSNDTVNVYGAAAMVVFPRTNEL